MKTAQGESLDRLPVGSVNPILTLSAVGEVSPKRDGATTVAPVPADDDDRVHCRCVHLDLRPGHGGQAQCLNLTRDRSGKCQECQP